MVYWSHSDRDLKSCQWIASDKSNLLRKVYFLLKHCFQVTAFLEFFGRVGYLITIAVIFVYKWAQQLFLGHYRMMFEWLFLGHFSDWWFSFIMVTWHIAIFQSI